MKNKKIVTLLLLLSLLTPTFAACGDSTSVETDAAQTTETETVVETEPETQFLPDDLPADLDFGGTEVNIFCWESWDPGELFVEEDTGDLVVSAVFNRNLTVEERLNVKLNFHMQPRNDAAYGSLLKNTISQQNTSGDGTYDLAGCYGMRVGTAAVEGLWTNLYDATYIDLEKPWYYQSAVQAGTLKKGYAFFFAGDISFNALARMSGVFFNRDMITDYGLEDPYDLVLEGKWTIDKMGEMIKDLYNDVDGNGKQSQDDQYGLMIAVDQAQTLYYGTGSHFIEHDAESNPQLSEDIFSERTVTILEKYLTVFADPAAYRNPTGDDPTIFDTGRTLFYIYPLGHVSDASLREAEFSYGFIPQPKVDETEKDYYASVTNAITLFAIPLVVKSLDVSSAVAECMSSEGHRQVTPVVFEQAYKVKYSQDDSARQSEIFDMMRANAVFDLGKIFADSFSGFSNGVIGDFIWNKRDNYASTIASKQASFEKAVENLVKNINIVE